MRAPDEGRSGPKVPTGRVIGHTPGAGRLIRVSAATAPARQPAQRHQPALVATSMSRAGAGVEPCVPSARDLRPCPSGHAGRTMEMTETGNVLAWLWRNDGKHSDPGRKELPVVAEVWFADHVRDDLADRRSAEVAARVPFGLPRHDRGRRPWPARMAEAMVQFLD